MADKIVALIGPGEGPWVYTGNMAEPRLSAIGADDGELFVEFATQLPLEPGEIPTAISVSVHSKATVLRPSAYTRVRYHKGHAKQLLVHIHSEVKRAKLAA